MCLSHLILHSVVVSDSHLPCRAHAMLRPCRGLEKNGMVGTWHGRGMANVNQARPRCVNQMGKTHSKPLAARHGRGTAWARHAMYESAFTSQNSFYSVLNYTEWKAWCQWAYGMRGASTVTVGMQLQAKKKKKPPPPSYWLIYLTPLVQSPYDWVRRRTKVQSLLYSSKGKIFVFCRPSLGHNQHII